MIIGAWSRPLPPIPGELLSSCLVRNAAAHGTTPYRLLALFWHRDPCWERDFDRAPSSLSRLDRTIGAPSWIDNLARAIGVEPRAIWNASLESWRFELGGADAIPLGDTPLVLSAGVHHRTRTRHALQYCPDCLADGIPDFRKDWRLGFVTHCQTHDRPLRDACPRCDAPVIPHRSMTNSLVDCHACGRKLTADGRQASLHDIPMLVRRLQDDLLHVVDRGDCAKKRCRGGAERVGLPLTVRSLLSASAASGSHDGLRGALGLPPAATRDGGRRRFEHARLAVRTPWLETVAAWMDDWPRNFLIGAEAIGASGRTFARCQMSPALAEQVAKLPARRKPPRKAWEPLFDEPVINHLRRHDRTGYHALRAHRILRRIDGYTATDMT